MPRFSRLKIYKKQAEMMFQDELIYRADLISRFISWGTRFLIAAFLWMALLSSQGGELAGYDLKKILTYFLLMQIVTGFTFSGGGFRVADNIYSGDLSAWLIQPVNYLLLVLSTELGRILLFFFANLVIYAGIGLLFPNLFDFTFKWEFILIGILLMFFSYLMNFSIVVMIGMLAFWFSYSGRLIYTYFAILTLISGTLVPLEFFPVSIQNILLLTPFPYLFYFPIYVMQSDTWTEKLSQGIPIVLLYTLLLMLLMSFMYKRGLKTYEAVGR